ncbi:cbb3-type cytochrome c oxidase subunit I [Prosthecomicrobium sp. N25]|uniref:cbb3-type cytochrome c oxidase subunit I n=1 Tax=Prosthecomicrobium sp. N25 TaxID=3129254 RepID=UPI003077806C
MPLPNPGPRPAGEVEALARVWARPRGWRAFSAVNNTFVGLLYIGTALLFFVLAGVVALVMRVQLAQPGLDVVGASTYNQLFTMHGTVMMFLFAVPVVEAFGVLLLPNMQAARDLPFPRLSAYAFWAYAIGGLAFFASLFFGLAPDGGWFMYPPLTSKDYSPGVNADFWLLGIGFIEISAIAGAVEIIVGVLKTRAPGQSLDKLPIYAWSMLVFAMMIVVAFPAVIVATLLLELERAFGWPFFIAAKGGDPILWQHLFWFFGHPEVYVIFLPAAGMVSMMVSALAGVPLVGYRLVVLALLGTGFLSFGLWAHHMFATGLPTLSLGFFSAASMAVAVPTGVQIFAWIATIAAGRLGHSTPTLFLLGFLFIFVIGGLTGVMVAMMPYDWQVHDTYFIVAHLHYVLIGGMVFPLFAAFYYWAPVVSSRPLSETLGKTSFWLMFVGVNVTFFTMHLTGLAGMPRRVYTYIPEVGWGTLNLISTGGAFLIAAGVAVFLLDAVLNFRPFGGRRAGNVWGAGTLEWLPSEDYQTRSIPHVASREPVWDRPSLAREVEAGHHYLPGSATGRRETIVTSPVEARPQYILALPGPSWASFLAAVFTAAFFLGLTVQLTVPAFACGVLAIVSVMVWMWDCDPGPYHPPVDIGGGIRIPVQATGPVSHAWWAMMVLMVVSGMIFACVVATYLYLWTANPGRWPPPGTTRADPLWPVLSAGAFLAGSAIVVLAGRLLPARPRLRAGGAAALMLAAAPWPALGVAAEVAGHWQSGLRPDASSYGAAVYTISTLQGFLAAVLALMAGFVAARGLSSRLDRSRRATYDCTMLLWHTATAQGLAGLALVHGVARLLA